MAPFLAKYKANKGVATKYLYLVSPYHNIYKKAPPKTPAINPWHNPEYYLELY